ncbi:ABC transporter substrate-binding protein [Nocardia fluminea]|uniref:ABC transporter substrate-binding protein n=1 Tax=Nocardia fluminea TaxID=134984 RepID=UPI003428834D
MKRPLFAAACVAAVATLAACTTSQTDGPGSAASDATVRLALTSDLGSFDPARAAGSSDYAFGRLLYSTLVGLDDKNVVVPRLAASWDVTATQATFTLNKGLTCSDGAPLTASQVAASLEYFRKTAPGAAYTFGAANAGDKTTITGDDAAGTVSVRMANPWSELLPSLGLVNAGIICKPGLDDPTGLATGSVPGAGTGPYVITASERGSRYTASLREGFDAFPAFAADRSGRSPATIELSIVKSESAAANLLQTGQLDFAGFTGPDGTRLEQGFETATAPMIRNFLFFNQRAGKPGADAEFRKAVAQAMDARAYDKVLGGSGTLLKSYVDSTANVCANTDDALLTQHDLASATRVLTGKKITVTGTNAIADGAGNTYAAEALRAAGAEVKLVNVDNNTWASSVLPSGDWDINVMASLSTTLLTASNLLTGAEPPQGRNYGAIHNNAFDQGLRAAVVTTDPTAKCAAWQQGQAGLLSAVDIVPLSTLNVRYVFSDGVRAHIPNGQIDLSTLRIGS